MYFKIKINVSSTVATKTSALRGRGLPIRYSASKMELCLSASMSRSFVVSGSTDLVGLLHANPVLKGFLEWHLEDLRQDMLTSQTALLKQAGQAEHALCSAPPPGLPQAASQLRVISNSAEAVGGQRSGGGQERQLSQKSL